VFERSRHQQCSYLLLACLSKKKQQDNFTRDAKIKHKRTQSIKAKLMEPINNIPSESIPFPDKDLTFLKTTNVFIFYLLLYKSIFNTKKF